MKGEFQISSRANKRPGTDGTYELVVLLNDLWVGKRDIQPRGIEDQRIWQEIRLALAQQQHCKCEC